MEYDARIQPLFQRQRLDLLPHRPPVQQYGSRNAAYDLRPFAKDMRYHGEPFKWDEVRHAQVRAKLDACYARLYGLTRDELRYILDLKEVYGEDFPGETFRVLKEKEIRLYGEYRTRRLVLEAWERLGLGA
jgi:hypothetical protein